MNNPSLVSAERDERATKMNQSLFQAMQASTNLQATFPSNHITTNHLGHPAPVAHSIQPQMTYPFNDANIERPIYSLDARGRNIAETDSNSASRDRPTDLSNDASSIGLDSTGCIAGPGVRCWCLRCAPPVEDIPFIPPAWDFDVNASIDDLAQSYNTCPSVDAGWYNSNTGSANGYNQDRSRLTYSNTANNGSHLAQLPHGSAPNSRRYSGFSFDPTLGSSQPSISSIGYPGGSYESGLDTDDMRAPPPNATQHLATPHDGRRQRYRERGQRRQPSPRPRVTISNSSIGSLECATFLKAQEILCTMLEDGKILLDSQKQGLANFLKISAEQVESCLEAKRILEPMLNKMCSKAQECGLPNDTVVRWFEQVQSHFRDKPSLRDSAYQSLNPPTQKAPEPPQKRRKVVRNPSAQRTFQCTYRYGNGALCLQESSNLTDWKRHEETHYPQRRWECLMEGVFPHITCCVCGQRIDTDIEQSQWTHARCFGQMRRKGHVFPRKDKLVPHCREDHGFSPNLEAWHYPVRSNWKPQCGFCGKMFSDWDLRCDHIGKHFTDGKRMVPDWRDPWPVEASSTPDENDDNDDGHGDDCDNNPDDKDAEGEDDPDHTPDRGKKRNDGDGHGHQSYDPSSSNNHQDRGSLPTYESGNGNHQENYEGNQNPTWSPGRPNMHQSLAFRSSPKIRDPEGDDDIFKSLSPLGYGTFGYVDKVQHTLTKLYFARKTVMVPHRLQAQREVNALRRLKHAHIVNLAASYTFEDQFSILMSPVAECNLGEYMTQDASLTSERLSNLARWVGCLVSALSYIHEKSCQHLDIKPSNILIAGDQVMLSDFGGAVFVNESNTINVLGKGCVVTPMYCAPEVADCRGPSFVAGASDIFSLGCVLLEIATVIHRERVSTFEEFRNFGSKNATYHNNHRKSLLWVNHLQEIDYGLGVRLRGCLSIITDMLSTDWKKRPTARGIENSLHYWHLNSKNEFERKNYLVIAHATTANVEMAFDPLVVARQWLRNCLDSHTCAISQKAFSPSRILNVGVDGDHIRLELSDPSIPYVALSYCWGTTSTSLKTTSQTLGTMFESIPISSLSNTFLNAVRITRALGFHHLWIDALCIVQDSQEDWTAQVSQMHDIYSQSSLTICMANDTKAPTCTRDKMLDSNTRIDNLKSSCSTCKNGYKAFKPLVDDTATTMLLDSSWSKRGWTLQERILSPRILYYSSNRIAWECDGERSTLDRVGQIRDNLKYLGIGNNTLPNKQEANPSFPLRRSFRETWREIVREFSKRQLSYVEDKLPALSGLAFSMAATSRQHYVAGLWKETLINDLLWCRDFPTIPLDRPVYRAPSWSWASIDSPIVWSKSANYPVEKNARVLDCQIKLISESAPFAGVSGAYLLIEGLTREVLVNSLRPEEILDRIYLQPLAFAQWDTLDVQKNVSLDSRLQTSRVEELLCLQTLSEAGLLLREVKEGVFQRVGIYWNQMHDEGGHDYQDWKLRSLTVI